MPSKDLLTDLSGYKVIGSLIMPEGGKVLVNEKEGFIVMNHVDLIHFTHGLGYRDEAFELLRKYIKLRYGS